ncbi:MAG: ABC transporter permease, partial [Clostridia bacterium]|nr:ABC transporter permease [Clostridia bacterium]
SNGCDTQDVILWGVDDSAKQVISVNILYGKAFSKYDISSKNNICLIDKGTSKKLFGRENSVGKNISILIGNAYEDFKITGIAQSDSGILQSIMGTALPNFCYIPYTTMQLGLSTNTLYQVAAKLDNDFSAQSVSKSVKKLLDKEKGIKNSVASGNLAASRSTLSSLLDTVSAVFSVIGIISLLVASLGILTVMLVSVNERTREIGIKKAVGASFSNILAEFLFEALTICLIGSIIGSVFGTAIIITGSEILGVNAEISFQNIIISVFGACFTGCIFGIYPAVKAAKMNPCEALRYE